MWTRKMLKTKAKKNLENKYGLSVLTSFLKDLLYSSGQGAVSLIVLLPFFFIFYFVILFSVSKGIHFEDPWQTVTAFGIIILFYLFFVFLTFVLYLLCATFLGSPLEVGCKRYYLHIWQEKPDIAQLFYAFEQNYKNTCKVMFSVLWRITVWTFLFFVPGIYYQYVYRFVSYLLAENPNLTPEAARSLSRRMTDGQKCNIFVLDLSFLGWIFLTLFTCGIGFYFLLPYMEATYAELFLACRTEAIQNGKVRPEEF